MGHNKRATIQLEIEYNGNSEFGDTPNHWQWEDILGDWGTWSSKPKVISVDLLENEDIYPEIERGQLWGFAGANGHEDYLVCKGFCNGAFTLVHVRTGVAMVGMVTLEELRNYLLKEHMTLIVDKEGN